MQYDHSSRAVGTNWEAQACAEFLIPPNITTWWSHGR